MTVYSERKCCRLLVLAVGAVLFMMTQHAPAAGKEQPQSVADSAKKTNYRIGPNDILHVYVWKEEELTQDVIVMPDGRISFPLIGEIEAQGKTVTGLQLTITEKLKEFITVPNVSVIVRESRSRIIYTIGKIVRPGPYPLAAEMTVIQALSACGGFAEWADEKHIIIVRREVGRETQILFNYKDFISGENVRQNILLKPGDTIVVP